jgi:hypothetical protein
MARYLLEIPYSSFTYSIIIFLSCGDEKLVIRVPMLQTCHSVRVYEYVQVFSTYGKSVSQ